MNVTKITKNICAAFLAAVLTVSCVFAGETVRADTMSDLEAKQARLEKDRKDVEAMLSQYEGEAEKTAEYLEEYDNKMKLQEEQVSVVEAQIALYEAEIAELEEKIAENESEVSEGVEQFKQRLRSLYMAGSDSMASVLTGSTSFYDMLARMEFVERVSKHDNDMIDSLNGQIAELEASKAERQKTLEAMESKKAEEEKYYDELRETYNNHAETKEMQDAMAADYRERADEIEAEQSRVEEELQAEIRRLQEEAERKRQEEERKRKEEEERRRQEEEQRRLEAEANGQEYVPQEVEVDTSGTFTSYSETGFIWPVPTVRNMGDGYGNRWIVEEQRNNFHKGIDITKPGCAGEPTVASAGGTVIQASDKGNGYGNCVIIDHGNGISTLYAHHQSLAVSVGDTVVQGQTLGYIGQTGNAYGNHLHFEVRINGEHTDPLKYVNVNN
ncbi:MAG: peptidoglycan DD-metalloendopeptidase family protein [Ruminococcus sp.]|nr:peptidoglycan DD-metalloendopeptidase family protein [Ruminococcus sp.]MCM1382526.1 peptidoglycan DD-metalloendopeptidase family protein [Muribaculaceae bacterium]MCM1478607.1 peptidoglycan DD-metalloendopeptidase family protein [Muribaculaceae bacterium]